MDKYLKEVQSGVNAVSANTPTQRACFKKKYSFSQLPHIEQLAIWDYVWHNTSSLLARSQCIMYCETFCTNPQLLSASWQIIVRWQDAIGEWWLCDFLSKIYTKTLEVIPDEVYPQLVEWNRDADLWKRRQSIVSLLYFQSTKKKHLAFDAVINLIEPLLDDSEYYVQKGVGWTLKELYQVYPDATYDYMLKNIKRITGIAFSPATEKVTYLQKQALKDKRR